VLGSRKGRLVLATGHRLCVGVVVRGWTVVKVRGRRIRRTGRAAAHRTNRDRRRRHGLDRRRRHGAALHLRWPEKVERVIVRLGAGLGEVKGLTTHPDRGARGALSVSGTRVGPSCLAESMYATRLSWSKNPTRGTFSALVRAFFLIPEGSGEERGVLHRYVCMYVKIRRHQHTRVHAHTGPRPGACLLLRGAALAEEAMAAVGVGAAGYSHIYNTYATSILITCDNQAPRGPLRVCTGVCVCCGCVWYVCM